MKRFLLSVALLLTITFAAAPVARAGFNDCATAFVIALCATGTHLSSVDCTGDGNVSVIPVQENGCCDIDGISCNICGDTVCDLMNGSVVETNANCPADCPAPVCGNGTTEAPEACDDGNVVSGDGCSATCVLETCSDGILNNGETAIDCGGVNCAPCVGGTCGDGTLDPDGFDLIPGNFDDEECDDGNVTPGDGCSATCIIEFCGDGIINNLLAGNEICDDANAVDYDGCYGSCQITGICCDIGPSSGTCVGAVGPGCIGSGVCTGFLGGTIEPGPVCPCIDGDGDGYGTGCGPGPDCNDADFDINPGATEVCDGIDNNCFAPDDETDSLCADPFSCTLDQCIAGACVNDPSPPTYFACSGITCQLNASDNFTCTSSCATDANCGGCYDGITDPDGLNNINQLGAGDDEQCDDGNLINTDACTNTCKLAVCGDGFTGPGEQCDDGNLIDNDACTNACTLPVCGDSITNGTDQCDDGNLIDNDACTNACTLPVCGDSITNGTDQCDDGNLIDNDACTNACTLPVCGDSITNGTDQCDDGNLIDNDACTNACTLPVCGDSITNGTDQCDDGNLIDNDACTNACTLPVCGDSITNGTDQCDDGNLIDNDACTNACTLPVCGDSITNGTDQCDDGNLIDNDACTNACTLPVCGDSITNGTDQCDDGNLIDNDACTNACTLPVCGDSITNGTDQCDDGNLIDNDACTNACTLPVCGDSITNGTDQCDDGNLIDNDACTNACTLPVCGDSITNGTDQCDDGNLINNDACTNACTLPVCGDSITNGTDQCDDGNLIDNDACTNACTLPVCGDSITNGTDQCDDGNLIDNDACSNACTLTTDLSLSKTVNNASPVIGTNVTFTVSVTNSGGGSATGVIVRDVLPSGYSFVSATPSQGTFTAPDWTAGTITSGQTISLQIVATVLPAGIYTNFSQVFTSVGIDVDSTPGNDVGNTPDEDDEDDVVVTPSAAPIDVDLSLVKTVSNAAPTIGTNVTFTITVNNAGPDASTGVVIRDVLPSGYSFVSATPSIGTFTAPDWTVGTLNSGQTETLQIVATVLGAGIYTNFAQVLSAGGTDPDSAPGNDVGNTPDEDDEDDIVVVPAGAPVCGDGNIDVGEQCDDSNVAPGDGCSPTCFIEVCGNGITDPGEACDDGNLVNTDACTNACTIPICGDGVITPPEQCDDLNNVPNDGCSGTCIIEFCGDAIINNGLETCDDGNVVPGDGCGATCLLEATCGDGNIDVGEQCDDSNILGGDGCSPTCFIEACGNGTIDPGEQCDDSNLISGDGCNNLCVIEACGNNVLDVGEACDDGNLVPGDGCSATCTLESCGNGITEVGEQCDDANVSNADACSNLCLFTVDLSLSKTVSNPTPTVGTNVTFTITVTNNSVSGTATGVTVADVLPSGYSFVSATPSQGSFLAPTWTVGTLIPAQVVTMTIVATVLPAGIYTNFSQVMTSSGTDVDSTPGNDVGNTPDEDDEDDVTTVPVPAATCGDGNIDVGEQCDDSNLISGDGCNNLCVIEACGNNVLDVGEACDDGNLVPGDGCSATCTLESCGNGITEVGEQCDDANVSNADACSNLCLFTVDLSLSKTVSNPTPTVGTNVTFTITVTNNSVSGTATGVTVADVLPSGYSFVSATPSQGSFLAPTWTVGTLIPAQVVTMTIVATVLPAGIYTNFSQVMTSSGTDVDSTPGNDVGNTPDEDDEDDVTTVPVPAATCGDGNIDVGEQCDDSNLISGDGCNNLCVIEACGNNVLDVGEACDDGNLVPGDGCSATCTLESCGNGITEVGEQCDDANVSNADACSNLCLFTVDLSLSKTVSNPTPTVGTNVTFTITVTNNSVSGTATGVTVADVLPSGYSFVSATPSQGSFLAPTWTVGTLIPAQVVTMTIVATVLPAGIYTNFSQVMTSSGTDVDSTPGNDVGNTPDEDDEDDVIVTPSAVCGDGVVNGTDQCDDGNAVNNDACTNACTLPVCGDGIVNGADICDDGNAVNTDTCSNACTPTIDLGLTKVVDNATPNVGDVITFTLSLSNTGTGPATGVVVQDLLPSGYTLGVATPSQGTFLAPDWTVGTVAAGQTVTMTITATVLPTGAYTNFAQVFTATGVDVNSTPGNDVGNTPNENDEASSSPSIQIADPGVTKTVDNPNPDLNGIISYFITVTNNGPTAALNVVVTDILPPGLTLQTANVTAGVLTLPTWTLATLAPLATETLTITARVDVANPITNSATLTTTTFDPDPSNNQDDVTITPVTGIVRGHLFWDDNRDGDQDVPEDADLANISMRVTDSRGTFVVVTDAVGNYDAIVAPGMVNISVDDTDPDFPDDYVITVDLFNRTVNVLGGQDLAVHYLGIDDEEHNPGQEDTKKDKKKSRSITVNMQRSLASTGIPLGAGTAVGFASLMGIIGLNIRRAKRY
jgi:uncharacterized repeat protein (TIGR01451 family)